MGHVEVPDALKRPVRGRGQNVAEGGDGPRLDHRRHVVVHLLQHAVVGNAAGVVNRMGAFFEEGGMVRVETSAWRRAAAV